MLELIRSIYPSGFAAYVLVIILEYNSPICLSEPVPLLLFEHPDVCAVNESSLIQSDLTNKII